MGTLVCYHRHQVNHDPFSHIGCQDITTHVNFSALDHYGTINGLESCGFTSQGYFLQALGLAAYCREFEKRAGAVSEEEKEFILRTLLLDMGAKFKVLIQQKGLRRPLLSGMRFRQPLV
jgi:SAM-dependent MidA family methyltransferase